MHRLLISSHSFGLASKKADLNQQLIAKGFSPVYQFVKDADLAQYDYLLVGTDLIHKDVIDAMTQLKGIVKYGIGTDNIDTAYCQEKAIPVCNMPAVNSETVAEFTIGLLFDTARKITRGAENMKNGSFQKTMGVRVTNKSAGILGTGSIGKCTAALCHGLGMDVSVYDPYPDASWSETKGIPYCSLDAILERCDFIIIHVPLLPSTRHMISTAQFLKMKPNAILINTARGGIVDENALYEAVKGKKIAGAAVDVYEAEPAMHTKLLTLDSVVCTPHMAAHCRDTLAYMDQLAIDKLSSLLPK